MPAMGENQEHNASDRNAFEEEYPASESQGAPIIEGLIMPVEVLSIDVIEFETKDLVDPSRQTDAAETTGRENSDYKKRGMEKAQQYWAKIYKGIQAKPLGFILGAAGIGYVCGLRQAAAWRLQNKSL